MRKILKKMKDEKGSITSVVLVTVLFFIIILSTALMISGTQRKSQLDSEITLKQVYQNQVDDAEKISKSFVVVKAPIPDGYYYVGGTDDSGVVISDNIADKDKYSGEDDVGKDLEGNQWVWVPVENPSSLYTTVTDGIALSGSTGVKTTKYTNTIISGKTRGVPGSTDYREPDILTSSNYIATNYATAGFSSLVDMAETMVNEYDEMIKSLEKYHGFYLGRYELTENGEKTGATLTNNWYRLYKECKTLANDSKVKTRMIWGLQWDATCNWLKGSGFNITDSTDWGYYNNNKDVTGYIKDTGYSENWKANNIYDFAGNWAEWTQESKSNSRRASRGGCFDEAGSEMPAAGWRGYDVLETADRYHPGSRPTLYLIP